MSRVLKRWSSAGAIWVGALTCVFAGVGAARGDDLVTLSGTTYHDVRPLRVEPDGVTWQYDEGICKVDFSDSSKKVCQEYHYDPAKAAAYRDAQAQARRQTEEQNRQILQENETRRAARTQAEAADRLTHTAADRELIYRRAASPAASDATRALGEQVQAAAAKAAVQPTGVFGAVAHSPAGTILSALGISFYQGPSVLNSDPSLPNQNEFHSGAHHAPAAAATDTAHDAFYTPLYLSKSYDEDVDRAAAFASGVPLKP